MKFFNEKKHVKFVIFICVFLYILFISSYLSDFYFNDATFSVGGFSQDIIDKYLYLWSDRFLGSDTLLEKLRGILIFILNNFGIFTSRIYYTVIFLLGFGGMYILLGIFKKPFLMRVLLSLFFIYNPFTIYHLNHFLIIQGVFIIPLLLYFYIQYLKGINTFFFLICFVLSALFLGQPHNFSNFSILLIIINISLFLFYRKFFYNIFLKNIALIIVTLISFSFVIFSFVGMKGNSSLTSSSKEFSSNMLNNIWSKNDTVFDIFQFLHAEKVATNLMFDEKGSAVLIVLGILISFFSLTIIMNFFFFDKTSQQKKFLMFIFIFFLGLTLIHRINLLGLNNIIYLIMPHLTVSANYAIPLYIYILIAIIYISNMKRIIFICLFIFSQIYFLFSVIYSPIYNGKNMNNLSLISNSVDAFKKKYKGLHYELLFPMQAKYDFGLLGYSVSPFIFSFDSFTFSFVSSEQMLENTRKLVKKITLKKDYDLLIKLFPYKYIISLDTENDVILSLLDTGLIKKVDEYTYGTGKMTIYINNTFSGLIQFTAGEELGGNISFYRENPIHYKILIDDMESSGTLSFLESFHTGWKLFKAEPENRSCINKNFYGNVRECESSLKRISFSQIKYAYGLSNGMNGFIGKRGYENSRNIDLSNGKTQYFDLYFVPQLGLYKGVMISAGMSILLLFLFICQYFYFIYSKK